MSQEAPNPGYRPWTAESLLALLESAESFQAEFGFPAAAGMREFLGSDDVNPAYYELLRAGRGSDPWQFGFAVIDEPTGQVVGTAGFKGPPESNGQVEIAYGIAPLFQGRGYATAAAAYLVSFARQHAGVTRICAHTLPEKNASTRVLEKNGFACVGQVEDPDDGPVWRWEWTGDENGN